MATLIYNSVQNGFSSLITNASGHLFALFTNSTAIFIYKSINGGANWSQVATVTSQALYAMDYHVAGVSGALDGSGLIHVAVSPMDETAAVDYLYNTFNTADNTWGGAWVQFAAISKAMATGAAAIAVDANSKPHALFVQCEASMGSNYWRAYYTNKVGANWLTPEMVSTGTTTNYRISDLVVLSSGAVDALYEVQGGALICRRTRSAAGAWGTETTTANRNGSVVKGLTVVNGTTYYASRNTSAPYDMYENEVDTNQDASGSTDRSAMAGTATTRYLFYEYNKGIRLISNNGGGWTAPVTLLATRSASGQMICAEWANNFEYQSGVLNYMYQDGNNLYFDRVSLSQNPVPPPPTLPMRTRRPPLPIRQLRL